MTPFAELLSYCIKLKEEEKMLTENRQKMPVRRIKELIAESEVDLFAARAVQNRAVVWDDPDGPERREAAKAWAEAISGRIYNLKAMLVRRDLKEAI